MMVSPTAVKASAAGNVDRTPVGAGAYAFVSWADGEKIVVKRNEKYWKPNRPYPDGIEFAIIPELTTGLRSVTPGQNDLIYQLPPRQKVIVERVQEPQGRQWPDALLLPDISELGEAAVRRHPGAPGVQLRDRPRNLRQGGARGPGRAGLHEPAEVALGLRQVGRRALSLRSRQGAEAARRSRLQGRDLDRARRLPGSGFGAAPGNPDRAVPQGRHQRALPQRADRGSLGGVLRRREARFRRCWRPGPGGPTRA